MPTPILLGERIEMSCEKRDERIEDFLSGERAERRCDLCRQALPLTKRVPKNPAAFCRSCRRAQRKLADAKKADAALPPNAPRFDRRKFVCEIEDRGCVLEIRESMGLDFDSIVDGFPTNSVDLEDDLRTVGRNVSGKRDFRGVSASLLQTWFSGPQIRLLRFLIWEARSANPQNASVSAARSVRLGESVVISATD